MTKINVITPPDVIHNKSTSFLLVQPSLGIRDQFQNLLEKFEKIQPKKFNFLTDAEGESKQKGYIAQEMVEFFPEAYPLSHDEENYYNYNPSGMVVYLTKAIKELIDKNKELENRIQNLED